MRLGLGLGVRNSTFVGGYDPAAAAFLSATGITGKTESDAINDLVVRLKGYGIWSKMKAIYPFVSDTYNLVSYSEDFNSWSKSNMPVTVDSTTAPNGTLTADKIIADTVNTQHSVASAVIGVTAGLPYTRSVYVKKGEYSNIVLTVGGFAAYNDWKFVAFNLDTNTFTGSSGSTTYGSSDAGNGWRKIWFTVTPVNSGNDTFTIKISNDPNNSGQGPTFAGNGTSGLYVWGAQFEQSSSVSTYQPIATTPANRFVSQFKYNLKDPRDLDAAFRLAFNGTWTYSKQGITGNGISSYASTYLNPSIVLPNSQNTSIYLRTYATGGSSYPKQFAAQASPRFNYLGGLNNLESYMGASTTLINDGSNTIGYFSAGGDNTLVYRKYRNNPRITKADVYLGANTFMNIGDSQANFTTACNVSFFNIGDALTDTEASNLYTSVQLFQQDLSRAVGTPITRVSDYDAQAFVSATQIQNSLQANAINTLVTGMKSANIWSKMKAIYPFVSDTYNLLSYTEDFPSWSTDGVSNASNVTISPDGTTTADTINDGVSSGRHINYQSFTGDLSQSRTLSVYAKQNSLRYLVLSVTTSLDANFYSAIFDLQTGIVSATKVYGNGTINASIVSVGNGWYRCIISGTLTTGTGNFYPMIGTSDRPGFTGSLSSNNIPTYTGTNITLYVWGAQLEQSASATPYTANLTTPANRFVSQFKYNLVSPLDADSSYRLAFNGSWTYALTGATPNGANAYANTYLNMLSVLTNNNNHMSFYSRTNSLGALPANYKMEMGVTDNTTHSNQISPNYTGTNALYENGSTVVAIANNNTTGMYIGSATSSTSGKLYKNNTVLESSTTLNTYSLFNNNIYLSATNVSSTNLPAYYSNREKAFTTIGDGLTDAEALALYNLTQAYQQTLNRQI